MTRKHHFLVSYILNDQPQSTEVESEAETLSIDQARFHIAALHTAEKPADITDVQVTRILHPKAPGSTPGHYQQP
ncbi:hypothetical protein AvCA_00290 [Azotobacter vinelandii CA]|uniref:Uncharacterized protein n=2 Tax=Azotobacter vinelandii TaxID=354 RepID=C1DFW9_AZOVD|nr:hypothetical protein [Azotobacter vinelandii]ACO76296.1 conserved hypothetical protein [Azotobacter vinelandii DJ]AGK15722.1 hypothetical protein AvCA_00290 [Azotobacter vinelandii CA]AGK19012.1 hypothetical protein AvCA6_00290 [Azotobacter vinelandii CA6]SFX29765.1 hypothetical protein SAMN04244547_01087 [Azotobacter vinelandii]GLK59364.1 hypothetical protein GCM10017624_15210 [Azotobacter vinelandii]